MPVDLMIVYTVHFPEILLGVKRPLDGIHHRSSYRHCHACHSNHHQHETHCSCLEDSTNSTIFKLGHGDGRVREPILRPDARYFVRRLKNKISMTKIFIDNFFAKMIRKRLTISSFN